MLLLSLTCVDASATVIWFARVPTEEGEREVRAKTVMVPSVNASSRDDARFRLCCVRALPEALCEKGSDASGDVTRKDWTLHRSDVSLDRGY